MIPKTQLPECDVSAATGSRLTRVLPDILAFTVGLSISYFFKWETRDLVWSLWLCSLVLGYMTLFSAIGSLSYVGLAALKKVEPEKRLPLILIGAGGMLFLLVFFSFHFGGFHAGHSAFLRMFFPIEGMPQDGFGRAFLNPPLLLALAAKHLLQPYGLFLIPAIISERKNVFAPIYKAVKTLRAGRDAKEVFDSAEMLNLSKPRPGAKNQGLSQIMTRPYVNVVRMHILILFFGFCYMLKIQSFAVYAVVYFVYFFPWRELNLKAHGSHLGTTTAEVLPKIRDGQKIGDN
jgi:hypothetical protein